MRPFRTLFVHHLLSFFLLYPLDLLSKRLTSSSPPSKSKTARWFCLHSLSNLVVVLTTLPDIVYLLSSPSSALSSPSSSFPLSFVNAIHAYHLLAFRPLRSDEVWHHLVFLPTCGLTGAVFEWGSVGNYLAFFICGLPGGITYALLSAQRCGSFLSLDEPSITAWINMYVRLPGILSSSTLLLVGVREGWTLVPLPVVLVQLFLSVWNGLKYAEEAVIRSTRERQACRLKI